MGKEKRNGNLVSTEFMCYWAIGRSQYQRYHKLLYCIRLHVPNVSCVMARLLYVRRILSTIANIKKQPTKPERRNVHYAPNDMFIVQKIFGTNVSSQLVVRFW